MHLNPSQRRSQTRVTLFEPSCSARVFDQECALAVWFGQIDRAPGKHSEETEEEEDDSDEEGEEEEGEDEDEDEEDDIEAGDDEGTEDDGMDEENEKFTTANPPVKKASQSHFYERCPWQPWRALIFCRGVLYNGRILYGQCNNSAGIFP